MCLEQKNFFETECQRHARDAALLKNEFETSRRQYEECLAQLRAHSTTLEQTVSPFSFDYVSVIYLKGIQYLMYSTLD